MPNQVVGNPLDVHDWHKLCDVSHAFDRFIPHNITQVSASCIYSDEKVFRHNFPPRNMEVMTRDRWIHIIISRLIKLAEEVHAWADPATELISRQFSPSGWFPTIRGKDFSEGKIPIRYTVSLAASQTIQASLEFSLALKPQEQPPIPEQPTAYHGFRGFDMGELDG